MIKRKKPTDSELVALLESDLKQTVGYADTKLARERELATKYYDGELPKPFHSGNSKYVSQDVYDSVESMKAQIAETFGNGSGILQFTPQGPEDVEPARIATEYCSYILFRQNPGFEIIQDVIHDALMGRNGIVKVWWEEEKAEEEFKFENWTQEQLGVYLTTNECEVKKIEAANIEESGEAKEPLFNGTLCFERDLSQVRVEVIPPEEFLISPRAKDIKSADFVAHRSKKLIGDLEQQGFDMSKVKEALADDSQDLDYEPEVIARFEQTGSDWAKPADADEEGPRREVTVYECYKRVDLDGEGLKLWKIIKVGQVVLDKEYVDRKPFVSFVPIRRPHSFWGSSFVSKVIPTQNARTTLTRGILDHTVITTNPRWQVVRGSLTNPKELMENRIGGIVNTTRPDGVAPLLTGNLNPFVFQTIQLLDDDKEQLTGQSRLSQGLNKDAISKQNSAGMVEQLINVSQIRQKTIARNFARFLMELFFEVNRLVIEHETKERIVQVAGNWVPVNPSTWADRKDAEVTAHLGYGEEDKAVQKWVMVDQGLSQDPSIAPMYGAEQKYYVKRKALEAAGFRDIDNILLHPSKAPQPQPDPMQQTQLQLAQQQLQIQERAQTLAEKKFELEKAKAEGELHLKATKVQADHAIHADKLDLAEAEFKHHVEVDKAELALQKKATDVKAVADPKG